MNSGKRTYADVLKNPTSALNPGMDPQPLLRRDQRVNLSESAKANLRAAIKGKAMVKSDTPTSPVLKFHTPVKSLMEQSSRLVLASASAGILPSFVMDDRCFMQASVNSAAVSLLKPNEIGAIVREGMKENPIDVCDESDDEKEKTAADEKNVSTTPCGRPHGDEVCKFCIDSGLADVYSIDGMDQVVDPSEFDASVFVNEVSKPEIRQEPPELNMSFRLETTRELKKAKRRMESEYMNDYAIKMKSFKRDYREDYEGSIRSLLRLVYSIMLWR